MTSSVAVSEQGSWAASISIEAGLYAALSLFCLGVRLILAAQAPFQPQEAVQALSAHALATGADPLHMPQAPSPGLLALQALLFSLFGSSEAFARLPVILLSGLSPLAFFPLRHVMGRKEALIAAAILSLSPTWAVLGAQGVGAAFGATFLLFALSGWMRALVGGEARWAALSGLAMGLALAAGAEAWLALLFAFGVAAWWGGRGLLMRLQLRPFLVCLAASFALASTACGLNPRGLQAALDLSWGWAVPLLRREPLAFVHQLLLYPVVEPLALALAALGLAERVAWAGPLGFWAVACLVYLLLAGQPLAGALLCLPALAALGALGARRLWRSAAALRREQRWESLAGGLALSTFLYIVVSGLSLRWELALVVLLLAGVGIGGTLLGLAWAREGAQAARATLAIPAAALLLLWAVAGLGRFGLASGRSAATLLRPEVALPGVQDLAADLQRLSWSRTADPCELPIVAEEGLSPLVKWQLRRMSAVEWVAVQPWQLQGQVVLTALPQLRAQQGSYVGQAYAVSARWQPRFAGLQSYLRWLLFREGQNAELTYAYLWVPLEGNAR